MCEPVLRTFLNKKYVAHRHNNYSLTFLQGHGVVHFNSEMITAPTQKQKQKATMKYITLHATPAYDVMNSPSPSPLPLRDPNVRNNYV